MASAAGNAQGTEQQKNPVEGQISSLADEIK
jgi:hypothetical protein